MKSNSSARLLLTANLLMMAIWITACSPTNPNYTLSVTTQPSSTAYAGTAFATQPVFTISPDTGTVVNQGDNITLTTYLDPACTIGSNGGFTSTANENTASIVNGVATFSMVSYGPPAHLEEKIYIKATGFVTGVTACTNPISVYQHFNAGDGNALFGTTGAAGGTGAGEIDNTKATILDSEGRIIIAGNSANAASPVGVQTALWRYFPDGTLDTSFGPSALGYVNSGTIGAAGATGAVGNPENDSAQAVQLDSLGRLIVVGTSANTSSTNASTGIELAIWRYSVNGVLDTSFGTDFGYVVSGATGAAGGTAAGEVESVAAMQLDSQGRIVIVGTSKNTAGGTELAIWRYLPNGTLDTSFASVGYTHFGTTGAAGGTGSSEVDTATGFQFDSTGNIVVSGYSQNAAGGTELALWRYLPTGLLDASFGNGGHAVAVTGATGLAGAAVLDKANSIQLDSQGRILLAGTSKNAGGGTELALWRYTKTGTLDVNFNTTGHVVSGTTGLAGATGSSENDVGNSLQLDALGNLVVGGSTVNAVGGTEAAVWRFLPTGLPDGTFGYGTGTMVYGPVGAAGATGAGEYDAVNVLTVDKVGRLVLSGVSENPAGGKEQSVWRYLSTGIIDL